MAIFDDIKGSDPIEQFESSSVIAPDSIELQAPTPEQRVRRYLSETSLGERE